MKKALHIVNHRYKIKYNNYYINKIFKKNIKIKIKQTATFLIFTIINKSFFYI